MDSEKGYRGERLLIDSEGGGGGRAEVRDF